MKLVSKKLSLVLAATALVFAGCTKKPIRPDPSSTFLGQPPGGPGVDNAGATNIPTQAPIDGLPLRDGNFDPNGQDHVTLAANTVYFELDQSSIKPSEREKLKAAKTYLDTTPGVRVLLEGHCDWRGTADYNLGLGDRRAAAVKKYLLSLGVAADRLETVSKGSLEAKPNADAATMEKDRRVDLVVVKAGAAPAGAPPAGFNPAATAK